MPTSLTDVDIFTSPIVIPADGDDIDESVHTPGFQGLANRTRNIFNKLLALTNGEFLYTTAGSTAVRSKSIFLPIEVASPSDGSTATYTDAAGWQMTGPSDVIRVPCHLPPGCEITGLQFGFHNQGSSGAQAVGVRLRRITPNTGAGSPNTVSAGLLVQNTTGGLIGVGVAGNLAFSAIIDSVSRVVAEIEAGAGDGASLRGQCAWIKLTYNDPGPRNGT